MFGTLAAAGVAAAGSYLASRKAKKNSQESWQMNYDAQKEFAQNGIRWKVEDAKQAGIHPLYALGASTPSFSPMEGYTGDNGIGQAASVFSQGINRAVDAKMTREERQKLQDRQEQQYALQLKQMDAQNRYTDAQIQLIQSEIMRNRIQSMIAVKNQTTQKSPPMPSILDKTAIVGQGDAVNHDNAQEKYAGGRVNVKPDEVTASAPEDPSVSAGAIPDASWVKTGHGGYARVRSSDVADRLDDDFLGTLAWNFRNYGNSIMDDQSYAPPKSLLPKGASHWVFNSGDFSWYPNTSKYAYSLSPVSPYTYTKGNWKKIKGWFSR